MSLALLPLLALSAAQLSEDFRRDGLPASPREVAVDLFLDPEGIVRDCKLLVPASDEGLEERYCGDVIGTAAGTPAIGPDGSPAFGTVIGFRIRPRSRNQELQRYIDYGGAADLEFEVASLPDDAESKTVEVLIYLDDQGRLTNCQQLPGNDLDYSRVACEQAGHFAFATRSGDDGQPVGYVTTLTIDFLKAANGG